MHVDESAGRCPAPRWGNRRLRATLSVVTRRRHDRDASVRSGLGDFSRGEQPWHAPVYEAIRFDSIRGKRLRRTKTRLGRGLCSPLTRRGGCPWHALPRRVDFPLRHFPLHRPQPFPARRSRCAVGAMSFKASKALMELRVHLCQSSAASKGIRCAPVPNFPRRCSVPGP